METIRIRISISISSLDISNYVIRKFILAFKNCD